MSRAHHVKHPALLPPRPAFCLSLPSFLVPLHQLAILTYGIFSIPAAACHLLIACTYTSAATLFPGGASFSPSSSSSLLPPPTLHSPDHFPDILPGAAEESPSHRVLPQLSYLSSEATAVAPVDHFIIGKATKILPSASALVGAFPPPASQPQSLSSPHFPFRPGSERVTTIHCLPYLPTLGFNCRCTLQFNIPSILLIASHFVPRRGLFFC
ncbi:hypothetical protein V8C35DRAFT_240322 [Trichoderma chlorosporum]